MQGQLRTARATQHEKNGPDKTAGTGHSEQSLWGRVSSKQSNVFFGSNRNKPKLNLFRLFFGLFRETKKHFFRFVSVCFGVSDRYRNNRNKQNFHETNRKNLKKIWGSSKPLIFFSVRTEPNRNSICFGCFSVCFFAKPNKFFFVFFRFFGPVSKLPKQIELMVWGIKKVDILTNVLLFRLVFSLFRLFRNTETPCFDIKAKQPKQTSCFG
jgi:hypothetical protein